MIGGTSIEIHSCEASVTWYHLTGENISRNTVLVSVTFGMSISIAILLWGAHELTQTKPKRAHPCQNPSIKHSLSTGKDLSLNPSIKHSLIGGKNLSLNPSIKHSLITGQNLSLNPSIKHSLITGKNLSQNPSIKYSLIRGKNLSLNPSSITVYSLE